MAKKSIKSASLNDLRDMKERGDLYHNADAPSSEDVGADFWTTAEVVTPVADDDRLRTLAKQRQLLG